MEKNKTRKPALQKAKYLKYAFGYSVLVIIGILIATSINNWNERRKANDSVLENYAKTNRELTIMYIKTWRFSIVKLYILDL